MKVLLLPLLTLCPLLSHGQKSKSTKVTAPDPCKQVTKISKPGETGIVSPDGQISFARIINASDTLNFAFVKASGLILADDGKGAVIEFSSGRTFEFEDITVDRTDQKTKSGEYIYEAKIPLTPAQTIVFSVSPVASVRLYVFESGTAPADAERYRKYAQCIFLDGGK